MPFWRIHSIYTPGHFGPWRTKCNQSLPMSSFPPVWVHCGCLWGLHRWWCCGHCPSSSAEGEGSMQKDGSWIWTSLESTNWVQSCFSSWCQMYVPFLDMLYKWHTIHIQFRLDRSRRLRGVSSRPFVGSVSAVSVLCALRDRCDTCWRGATDGWIVKKKVLTCWWYSWVL